MKDRVKTMSGEITLPKEASAGATTGLSTQMCWSLNDAQTSPALLH